MPEPAEKTVDWRVLVEEGLNSEYHTTRQQI